MRLSGSDPWRLAPDATPVVVPPAGPRSSFGERVWPTEPLGRARGGRTRSEDRHPGAQLSFADIGGHRFQICETDLAEEDVAYIEALYRGRGRAKRRICEAKDTGLANLPSASFAINQVWVEVCLFAQDLLCWPRLLLLDGDLGWAEPKRLRYCLGAEMVARWRRLAVGRPAHRRGRPAPHASVARLSQGASGPPAATRYEPAQNSPSRHRTPRSGPEPTSAV